MTPRCAVPQIGRQFLHQFETVSASPAGGTGRRDRGDRARGSATASTRGARSHARAQATAAVDTPFRPVVPATDALVTDHGGAPVDAARVLWDELLGPGGDTARAVPRGTTVRLTDVDGDACANLLLYNADRNVERLNVADTTKVQWQAYLGAGSVLLSDMGRVLASIVVDTVGAHDTLCGASNRAAQRRQVRLRDRARCMPERARPLRCRAREARPRPARHRSERELLQVGHASRRTGRSVFHGDRSRPGAVVELRAELPLLVVVANTPHVLDARSEYTVGPLRVTAWTGEATTRADPAWSSTPERERAFLQTEELLREGAW